MPLPLEKRKVTIGWDPDNDIVVEELHVSHRHCVIRNNGDGYELEDCASSNGTYVNGSRIRGRVRLRNNDVITLGKDFPVYRFRLHSGILKSRLTRHSQK